ncbi:MAG: FAD-dependent oxidoreductase, partial [Planctomycetota bacterium]
GLDNLLIASRAISCDFEAHGATRVMAPVACYGEAAGIAAALAVADGQVRAVALSELQARLRAHGQFVEELA